MRGTAFRDSFLDEPDSDVVGTDASKYYSGFSSYLIMMNVIIGSGCLGLPYAFSQGGWLLGICVISFSTISSTITMGWLLEAMARADALERTPRTASAGAVFEATADEEAKCRPAEESTPMIRDDRKFEVLELVNLFLPAWAARACEIAFLFYMYCLLWSYSVMFGSSVAYIITNDTIQAAEHTAADL